MRVTPAADRDLEAPSTDLFDEPFQSSSRADGPGEIGSGSIGRCRDSGDESNGAFARSEQSSGDCAGAVSSFVVSACETLTTCFNVILHLGPIICAPVCKSQKISSANCGEIFLVWRWPIYRWTFRAAEAKPPWCQTFLKLSRSSVGRTYRGFDGISEDYLNPQSAETILPLDFKDFLPEWEALKAAKLESNPFQPSELRDEFLDGLVGK